MRELHPMLATKLLSGPPRHRQTVGTARLEPWRPSGSPPFILEVRLERIDREVSCVSWENRRRVAHTTYDLVINLEDDRETSSFLKELKFKQLFGAHLNGEDKLTYTSDSRDWFDLSLISTYGREKADRLKLLNRRTYQEFIFEGLGFRFCGEPYCLPPPCPTGLQ